MAMWDEFKKWWRRPPQPGDRMVPIENILFEEEMNEPRKPLTAEQIAELRQRYNLTEEEIRALQSH